MARINIVKIVVGILAILVALPLPVHADKWASAKTKTYRSDNLQYRFRIIPGIGFALISESDKDPFTARAEFYNTPSGKSGLLWDKHLSNTVAPVHVIISNDGQNIVTFDNWGKLGMGDNVLVIYDDEGNQKFSYSLEDLLTTSEIKKHIRKTVSSRGWRKTDPYFDANEKNVAVPTVAGLLVVSLSTGEIVRGEAGVSHWADAPEAKKDLKKFLEIFKEAEKLQQVTGRSKIKAASKRLQEIEKEAAGIVFKYTGASKRDDYSFFEKKAMLVLLEASKRFDKPFYTQLFEQERKRKIEITESKLQQIVLTLFAYETSNSRFPPDDEGLEILTFSFERPAYIQPRDLLDAWNRPFVYSAPHNAMPSNPFTVFSAGPDGFVGTKDDVYPPENEY